MFFRRNRKGKGQTKAEAAPTPKAVEVWWRGHTTHPWQFMSRFERMSDAQAAARHMTTAQVDIRPIY